MDPQITAFAWPGIVLIIGVVFLIMFRTQIGGLIDRTKKLGKGGIETFENQPMQPREEKKGIDDFYRSFDSPLLLESEQLIRQDLKDRKIDTTDDREKALVRALASVNLVLHFERVYGLLWASQLTCVRYLNARDEGAEPSEIHPIYEAAKKDYPNWYENYAFDRWLGFLSSFNLIREQDSKVFVTVAGREFLKYLVASGKPGPYHG